MEQEILDKLLTSNFGDLVKTVMEEVGAFDKTPLDQYHIDGHKVQNPAFRQNKTVQVTEVVDGIEKSVTKSVNVSRLALPIQKKIVDLRAYFLCGNPIEIVDNAASDQEARFAQAVQKIWTDAKLDFDSKKIAKILFSETQVAELWYAEQVEPDYWNGTPLEGAKFKLRMRVLSNGQGDKLYPLFNVNGDMIGFGRGYETFLEGKKVEAFDFYTETRFYFARKASSDWEVTELDNVFKKIPVIFYSQARPEWYDVQSLIERLETLMSNHADSNDYFGSPIVKVKGNVKGFSSKGEQGKVLEIDEGGDASYLTWDQGPGSIELELKNLRSQIFDMTNTPDISIEQMKSLGTYSGIALKMLFMSAHLAASDKEELFGKGIQRRLNFLKVAVSKIKEEFSGSLYVELSPRFEYFLPKNDQEKLEMLSLAVSNKQLMSRSTAIKLNPLVENADKELEDIKVEEDLLMGQYLNQ